MLWHNGCMRKTRLIENCRCYHLMSRLAHRAFFLDDGEGADQADGSRPSAVAATAVSPGMSYSINTTLLAISDLSIS